MKPLSRDIVDLLGDLIAEHYSGDSTQAMMPPISTLLAAQDEIVALRLRLAGEIQRGHDLQAEVAALQSPEHCASAHDNTDTCGWCQRDECLWVLRAMYRGEPTNSTVPDWIAKHMKAAP